MHPIRSILYSTLGCCFPYHLLVLKHPNFPIVVTDVSSDRIPIRLKIIFMIMFDSQLCGEIEAH